MTREEAIYILLNTAWLAPSLVPVDEAIDMAIKALQVDIVRCKECKYFSVIEDYFMCGVWSNVTNEDEFCSYGERRSDDSGKSD